MRNKKGQLELLEWAVIVFITVLFIGIWVYGHGLLTDALVGSIDSGDVNVSGAAQDTFQKIDSAYNNGIASVAFIILFMSGLSILIINYFVRDHPLLLVVHIFVTFLAVVISVYISNVYEGLLSGQPFSSDLLLMKAASSVILHLPVWVTVIGIIGAVIMAIRITRTREDFA